MQNIRSVTSISISLHLVWIQHQAAHPELRSYTTPRKLACFYPKSSSRISLPLNNGSLNCCVFCEPTVISVISREVDSWCMTNDFFTLVFIFSSPIGWFELSRCLIGHSVHSWSKHWNSDQSVTVAMTHHPVPTSDWSIFLCSRFWLADFWSNVFKLLGWKI